VHYLLNYSPAAQRFAYGFGPGHDLLSGNAVSAASPPSLEAWGVAIVEEDGTH
jgi:hypothetical protein